MKTLLRILVITASLVLPAAAQAHVQRPVKPPAPNPMPRIVQMTDADPMADWASGYFDGEAIHVADLHDRFAVQHELGHVFDARYLDAGERQRFATLEACDKYGCDEDRDLAWETTVETPDGLTITGSHDIGELFADAYAACRLQLVPGALRHVWTTGYGYNPTASQHRQICRFMAAAAQDAGTPLDAQGWR